MKTLKEILDDSIDYSPDSMFSPQGMLRQLLGLKSYEGLLFSLEELGKNSYKITETIISDKKAAIEEVENFLKELNDE